MPARVTARAAAAAAVRTRSPAPGPAPTPPARAQPRPPGGTSRGSGPAEPRPPFPAEGSAGPSPRGPRPRAPPASAHLRPEGPVQRPDGAREEERETSWLPSQTTSPVPPWGSGWCFRLPFAVLQGTRALEGLAHLAGNCLFYKEH